MWNAFAYDFIDRSKLNKKEGGATWTILSELLRVAAITPRASVKVRISKTMRLDEGADETEGVWDSPNIVVKRSVLDSRWHFARVVLHMIAHATSGANHASLAFMAAIDDLAGIAAVEAAGNAALLRPTTL